MPALRNRSDIPSRFALPTDSDFEALAEDSKRVESLDSRQKAVLAWLAHGKSNPEIAPTLNLSRSTIEREITLIFDELGVENRIAASVMFLQWRLRESSQTHRSK